jgi:hypothetical protein
MLSLLGRHFLFQAWRIVYAELNTVFKTLLFKVLFFVAHVYMDNDDICFMKRYLIIFKNKFVLAITIFLVYALFLDDVDVFMIFSKQSRLRQLEQQKIELADKLSEIENMQRVLDNAYSLEKFAREERFFHKADEDVYVIEWLE